MGCDHNMPSLTPYINLKIQRCVVDTNPRIKTPVSSNQNNKLNASTIYAAVYGHPIRHSASPAMQNAGIAELGLNWRYLAFDVLPEQLTEALSGAKAMRYVGLNLTVPHKLLALDWVDIVDPAAKEWGAVNTIRFEGQSEDGSWTPLGQAADPTRFTNIRSVGFNTDADAILRSIGEDLGLSLKGTTCILLGAGGAGRVAALKLASAGVKKLHLINRTQSKSEAVASDIHGKFPEVETSLEYPKHGTPVDLMLNATSLGLKADDPLPVNSDAIDLKNVSHAYDMIYQPAQTPFLKQAAHAGCRTANGLGMLLYQGTAALEIWTGQTAPTSTMQTALHEHVYEKLSKH
ncbi:MAG: shikimate dehydrogenase [Verrucomicrobia bacterium]|nr:shikimate dehydrogenase [Verrucomicrobiota bacterium]